MVVRICAEGSQSRNHDHQKYSERATPMTMPTANDSILPKILASWLSGTKLRLPT